MEHLLSDLKDLRLELVDEPYSVHETDGTETRTTAHNPIRTTIRTVFTGKVIPWQGAVLIGVVLVALLGLAAWWFWGSGKKDPSVAQGSMRTVPITSWSSGARELVSAASFSPDARMVAFAAMRTGSSEIWVKPTAGGDDVQVTKNGFYNQYPVWSPNNQDIAFFSARGNNNGIWRAAFTGGNETQIASGVGPMTRPLHWSKDGKIYFQEGSDVFTVDERSGEKARVTDLESRGVKPRAIEVSPDGSNIAYSVKEGDNWKVKVQRVDSDSPIEIATSPNQIDYLAWRPQGESVIFSNSVEGAYQVFEATPGRDPVQLSNGNVDFFVEDVSFDDSKILYGSVNETSDLWTVSTEDPKESPVANDVAAEYWADFSPDGKSIAFQSVTQTQRPFGGSIKVRPQSDVSKVVSPSGFSPVWSNDGQWIAYFKRTGSGIEIWRTGPTGEGSLKLAGGPVSPPSYMETPYLKIGTNHLAWSPDNTFIAYSASADGISNLWLARSDGGGTTSLTRNTEPADGRYCCPIWTPDGKQLLFTSAYVKEGTPRQVSYRLWWHDYESAATRLLYESNREFRLLGLSKDTKDAIISEKDDPSDLTPTTKSTNVYSLSLQTGAKSRVNALEDAYFHNIHLSRDGRMIGFVSRRGNVTTLWTVPVNGGTPKQLLVENDPKVLISSLTFSPDGRSIVFGKQTRTHLLSMLAK
jgi:Tol biopolymer transport system component